MHTDTHRRKFCSLSIIIRRPAHSTLFPYTTLFRSSPEMSTSDDALRSTRISLSSGATKVPTVKLPSSALHAKCPSSVRSSAIRSEEHTSELQSRFDLVCRLLLEKKKIILYYLLICI